jgi:hypothetical protein
MLIFSVVPQLANYPSMKAGLQQRQNLGCGAAYLPPYLAFKLESILVPKGTGLSQGLSL